eukprot:6190644-Pleurochrysis_carterae.AAC.7
MLFIVSACSTTRECDALACINAQARRAAQPDAAPRARCATTDYVTQAQLSRNLLCGQPPPLSPCLRDCYGACIITRHAVDTTHLWTACSIAEQVFSRPCVFAGVVTTLAEDLTLDNGARTAAALAHV